MQPNSTKGVKEKDRLSGKGDLIGIVSEIEFWPY